jgi:hypothetical protein
MHSELFRTQAVGTELIKILTPFLSLAQGTAPPTIFVVKRGFLRMVRKLSNANDEHVSGLSRLGVISRPGLKIHRSTLFDILSLNQ